MSEKIYTVVIVETRKIIYDVEAVSEQDAIVKAHKLYVNESRDVEDIAKITYDTQVLSERIKEDA